MLREASRELGVEGQCYKCILKAEKELFMQGGREAFKEMGKWL